VYAQINVSQQLVGELRGRNEILGIWNAETKNAAIMRKLKVERKREREEEHEHQFLHALHVCVYV